MNTTHYDEQGNELPSAKIDTSIFVDVDADFCALDENCSCHLV